MTTEFFVFFWSILENFDIIEDQGEESGDKSPLMKIFYQFIKGFSSKKSSNLVSNRPCEKTLFSLFMTKSKWTILDKIKKTAI